MDPVRRPYDASTDESTVLSMWIRSYAHSTHGMRRLAHVRKSDESRAWWDEHRPFLLALMRQSEIFVVCDSERPDIIWGWIATSGDTIHYLSVKRSAVESGLAVEIVHQLLGGRLERPCAYTMELVELRRVRGIRVPSNWYPDFTFHVRGLAA